MTSGGAARAHHLYPLDRFPFAFNVITDALTGKTDGIMKRPETDPLVILTNPAADYWSRRGSLVHTDSLGNDIVPPENVRIYLLSCTQHRYGPNEMPRLNAYRHMNNPINITPVFRAVIDVLDAWATDGTLPPENMIPTKADGTLVSMEVYNTQFPSIPDIETPSSPNPMYVIDYGPDYDEKGITTEQPPMEYKSKEYAVLVPQVDSDGNEIAGIRLPHIEVPLATFTGWNFYPKGGAKENALSGNTGACIPFERTLKERSAKGDPRPSIEERYPSKAHYVRLIALAAQKLVNQRLMLDEDADRYVDLALNETDLWAQRSVPPVSLQPRERAT